jgi:hypothetical protein
MGIHFYYFHSINHPQFGKPFFSGLGCINTKLFIYCGCQDHVWFEDRWMVACLCDE